MLQLIATPSNALADEPVSIRAIGLPPSQIVTITATVKDEKENLFQSKAFYKANEAGEVDLEQASALGGDYVGVHPMGLFCCLKPKRAFQRLIKKDVMNSPLCICLDLYDSVCWLETVRIAPKASQIVHRWFAGPGVKREQIREGRVRGALFLPPGKGPFPGIIDLFGSIGGLVEFRASLLASRGFAVLALAYFAYEDLPKELLEEDLDYFEEAANFLLAHPKIQQPGIGVISVSKGAEIGLAMACYLKQVAATVCINGPSAVFDVPLRYGDLVVTPMRLASELMQVHPSGAVRFRHCSVPQNKLNSQKILPVEKAQGKILFIAGENDESLASKLHAQRAPEPWEKQWKDASIPWGRPPHRAALFSLLLCVLALCLGQTLALGRRSHRSCSSSGALLERDPKVLQATPPSVWRQTLNSVTMQDRVKGRECVREEVGIGLGIKASSLGVAGQGWLSYSHNHRNSIGRKPDKFTDPDTRAPEVFLVNFYVV